MGTVVLCTSCPFLNECVILFDFHYKKHAYSFFSSYPYYSLVHNHIWISYFIPYFHLLECRFIPRQHRNTFCLLFVCLFNTSIYSFICSEIFIQTNSVPIMTRYIPLFYFFIWSCIQSSPHGTHLECFQTCWLCFWSHLSFVNHQSLAFP